MMAGVRKSIGCEKLQLFPVLGIPEQTMCCAASPPCFRVATHLCVFMPPHVRPLDPLRFRDCLVGCKVYVDPKRSNVQGRIVFPVRPTVCIETHF